MIRVSYDMEVMCVKHGPGFTSKLINKDFQGYCFIYDQYPILYSKRFALLLLNTDLESGAIVTHDR